MENEKGKVSKGLVIGLIITTLIVVGVVSCVSYLYYNAPKKVEEKNLDGGSINLSYSDDSNASTIDYEVSVIPDKENTVPVKNIKVYLEKLKSGTFSSTGNPSELKLSKKATDLGSKSGSMVIYSNSTKKSVSENYRLRAWVDNTSLYVPTMTDKIVLNVEVHGKAS